MIKKNTIIMIIFLAVVFTFIGGTMALWTWKSNEDERTNVVFTANENFSCSADGGGHITHEQVDLIPTYCTNSTNAIQRVVKVSPTINKDNLSIYMDLRLNINTIGIELSNSQNFKYALTTYPDSCTTGVISSGTFNGKTNGTSVSLLDNKVYSSTMTDTYYLYIWLDSKETSDATMNQEFNFSLGGECGNNIVSYENIIESLQETYDFEYYSTLNLAVTDVNNSTIGTNADSDKENAMIGVYTDNGDTYVMLLKDITETTRIKPSVDMTINLGGHAFTSLDGVAIDSISGNVTVDGTVEGSKIQISHSDGTGARPIQVRSGNFVINGGTYISNSVGATTSCIYGMGNITVNDATIIATNSGTTGTVRGIEILKGGTATVTNCNVQAFSNYDSMNGVYTASSIGIISIGTLTVNNTYAMGTHSGIQNDGTLYVNGGTYESYGHGGIYFSGVGTTSYASDATLRGCDMPDGYTTNTNYNHTGIYIGGNTGMDNNNVYIDNCDIYGKVSPIVLRGTSGEQNNTLYISSSRVNTDVQIRIDNDTHKLYSGIGNNFNATNTTLPSAFIQTGEIYINE